MKLDEGTYIRCVFLKKEIGIFKWATWNGYDKEKEEEREQK